MTDFIYETHLHTSEASKCADARGADYIDYMISRGYAGMIVTDHFFNGNSSVDTGLTWEQMVGQYVSGYKNALRAAEGKLFDVLFGIEFNFNGDEYLIYGPDENWLLHNEDIVFASRTEVYRRVHEAGGIMVQAHPYRERDYLDDIRLTPGICDGIEVYNAANSDNMNALAYRYARRLNVPMTAGSDIHNLHDKAMGGMSFNRRIMDIRDFVSMLLSGEGTLVKIDGKTPSLVEGIDELKVPSSKPSLPVLYY